MTNQPGTVQQYVNIPDGRPRPGARKKAVFPDGSPTSLSVLKNGVNVNITEPVGSNNVTI